MNQIGLCIMDRHYRDGFFRVEFFETQEHLEWHRAKMVDPSATTWVLGTPVPKRKRIAWNDFK